MSLAQVSLCLDPMWDATRGDLCRLQKLGAAVAVGAGADTTAAAAADVTVDTYAVV